MSNTSETRELNLKEKKFLSESVHNLVYEKKSKYRKKGAPETIEQFEEYRQELLEIEMLEDLKVVIESGRIVITPPEGQGSPEQPNATVEVKAGK